MKKKYLLHGLLITLCAAMLASCAKDDVTPEKVYSRVGISKLTILNYPQVNDNNEDWDGLLNGYYPDIYFALANSAGTSYYYVWPQENRKENLRVADLPSSFNGSGGGTFYAHNDLNKSILVSLWDYDTGSDDEYLGAVEINFSDYTTGTSKYPTSITKTLGDISIKLELAWLE